MPTNRDDGEPTFNNTYHNGTLVGNWLEDRLQRRPEPQDGVTGSQHEGHGGGGGLLEDLRITRARDAPQVRHDLMHTTYDVDYSRKGSGEASVEGSARGPHAPSVLLASTAARGASGGGGGAEGRGGVNRALLFSKDPVADPVALLPVSTNTDTYGAFYAASPAEEGNEAAGDDTVARQRALRTNGREGRGEERSLYDSVMNARAKSSIGIAGTRSVQSTTRQGGGAAAAAATLSTSARGAVVGFASLAVPASETTQDGGVSASAHRSGMAGSSAKRKGSKNGDDDDGEGDVGGGRWCTSQQAADVPVDHYIFQRRLPPVRM